MRGKAVQICTNYFNTPDPARLESLLASVKTAGAPLVYSRDSSGRFMFRCDGAIMGTLTDRAKRHLAYDPGWAARNPDEAYSTDAFYVKLQDVIAPDDACIVQNFYLDGTHRLRCEADIVTNKKIGYLDMDDMSVKKTRAMLNNNTWRAELKPAVSERSCDGTEKKPGHTGKA